MQSPASKLPRKPMPNDPCPCGSGKKYKQCCGLKEREEAYRRRHSNLVLIGLPGAGKSTLGVVLAKMLGYRFIDCDLVIQEAYGKTLQEIIDENGPAGFIEIENKVLQSIDAERSVISTGGSAVYSHEAMLHMKEIGTVIYLQIPYEEMAKRLGDLDERGVVLRDSKVSSLRALYDERIPLYEEYADIVFEANQPSIRESALALRDVLGAQGWSGVR